MPSPKRYSHQLPVSMTDEQHAYVTRTAGETRSQGQVVREALDLARQVASGELVTFTAAEAQQLIADASATQLVGGDVLGHERAPFLGAPA